MHTELSSSSSTSHWRNKLALSSPPIGWIDPRHKNRNLKISQVDEPTVPQAVIDFFNDVKDPAKHTYIDFRLRRFKNSSCASFVAKRTELGRIMYSLDKEAEQEAKAAYKGKLPKKRNRKPKGSGANNEYRSSYRHAQKLQRIDREKAPFDQWIFMSLSTAVPLGDNIAKAVKKLEDKLRKKLPLLLNFSGQVCGTKCFEVQKRGAEQPHLLLHLDLGHGRSLHSPDDEAWFRVDGKPYVLGKDGQRLEIERTTWQAHHVKTNPLLKKIRKLVRDIWCDEVLPRVLDVNGNPGSAHRLGQDVKLIRSQSDFDDHIIGYMCKPGSKAFSKTRRWQTVNSKAFIELHTIEEVVLPGEAFAGERDGAITIINDWLTDIGHSARLTLKDFAVNLNLSCLKKCSRLKDYVDDIFARYKYPTGTEKT